MIINQSFDGLFMWRQKCNTSKKMLSTNRLYAYEPPSFIFQCCCNHAAELMKLPQSMAKDQAKVRGSKNASSTTIVNSKTV